jgi:uncharacterized membrane protein YhaH (DUF805 family)
MFCTNCGNKVGEGVLFCPKCGERVTRDVRLESTPESEIAPPSTPQIGGKPSKPSFSGGRIGRVSRAPFFLAYIFIFLPLIATIYLNVPAALFGLVYIAWIIWFAFLCVARLHDCGTSAWYGIKVIACFALPILILILFVWKGESKPNDYGTEPSGKFTDVFTFWK